MEVFRELASVDKEQNAVITVGTFDGVHLGHVFVINSLLERARRDGATATLVTFEPHPKLVLNPPAASTISILTTLEEKLAILEELGLDRVVVLKFTRDFSRTSSDEFLKKLLFEKIGFKEIVIGYDHGFGRDRKGSIATAKEISKQLDFAVTELPKFENNVGDVSSSSIRSYLETGDVEKARLALGRYYILNGVVAHGDGRGKNLNYPTANVTVTRQEKLIPGAGVYAVHVHVGDQHLNGMMNVGVRPTFNGAAPTLEVHMFDFEEDVYEQEIQIEFVTRLRDEIRFNSSTMLVEQLDHDKEKCLKIFSHVM